MTEKPKGKLIKLGETFDRDGQLFVATGIVDNHVIWTPIPEGMSEYDLGRKWPAAMVTGRYHDPPGTLWSIS